MQPTPSSIYLVAQTAEIIIGIFSLVSIIAFFYCFYSIPHELFKRFKRKKNNLPVSDFRKIRNKFLKYFLFTLIFLFSITLAPIILMKKTPLSDEFMTSISLFLLFFVPIKSFFFSYLVLQYRKTSWSYSWNENKGKKITV